MSAVKYAHIHHRRAASWKRHLRRLGYRVDYADYGLRLAVSGRGVVRLSSDKTIAGMMAKTRSLMTGAR